MDILEFLHSINTPWVIAILFSASAILVIVDFYFPVDWPAHIGYLCFGIGAFLVAPFTVILSIASGVVAFGSLEIMHHLLFHKFLTNAPGTESVDAGDEIDLSA